LFFILGVFTLHIDCRESRANIEMAARNAAAYTFLGSARVAAALQALAPHSTSYNLLEFVAGAYAERATHSTRLEYSLEIHRTLLFALDEADRAWLSKWHPGCSLTWNMLMESTLRRVARTHVLATKDGGATWSAPPEIMPPESAWLIDSDGDDEENDVSLHSSESDESDDEMDEESDDEVGEESDEEMN
jgi:hypothetical protein